MSGESFNPDTRAVFGVILAAGKSKRFGTDKLLYPLSGKPIYSWILDSACKSLLAGIIFICREELLYHLPSKTDLQAVINPTPEEGLSSSMRLGISLLPDQASHVLFLLADQPLITSALIDEYIALATDDNTLACFSSEGYEGPPALFGKKWFDRLRTVHGDTGAKQILLKQDNLLQQVQARFPGQEKDIDYIENIQTIEKLILHHKLS